MRLLDRFQTGDEAEIDMPGATLTNRRTGEVFKLQPLGAVGPVVAAGGIFAYARKTGMLQ